MADLKIVSTLTFNISNILRYSPTAQCLLWLLLIFWASKSLSMWSMCICVWRSVNNLTRKSQGFLCQHKSILNRFIYHIYISNCKIYSIYSRENQKIKKLASSIGDFRLSKSSTKCCFGFFHFTSFNK